MKIGENSFETKFLLDFVLHGSDAYSREVLFVDFGVSYRKLLN